MKNGLTATGKVFGALAAAILVGLLLQPSHPAHTPTAVVAKINHAFAAALADPFVKAQLGRNSVVAVGQPVEDFRAFLGAEETRFNAIIQAGHIQ